MPDARIITEDAVLKACQLLYARRGRPPQTLALHPADWVGLRTRLQRRERLVGLRERGIVVGPFELAVVLDPECPRGEFGLLYGSTEKRQ